MKKKCALEAVKLIENGMVVGFGGGSTVGFMIEEAARLGLEIEAVTPSMLTEELCRKHGIPVRTLAETEHVDIAFDGCDELDANFNALKSCGGIHTREKLVAAMADKYVLLADEAKFFPALQFNVPVAFEVLPAARSYVKRALAELGAEAAERYCSNKMGLTITDDGNYLMDAQFANVKNPQVLNKVLNNVQGVVNHSLFCELIDGAVIAGKDEIRVLWK